MATTKHGYYYPSEEEFGDESADVIFHLEEMAKSNEQVADDLENGLKEKIGDNSEAIQELNNNKEDKATTEAMEERLTTAVGAIQQNAEDIESIEGDIADINEKDESQDESIEENYKAIIKLQAENEELKSIVDQMPHVEGEGYKVQLKPTINAKMSLLPDGHSEQETTSISDGDEYDSPSPGHKQDIASCGDDVNEFDGVLETGGITNGINVENQNLLRSKNYISCSENINFAFSINSVLNRVAVSFYDINKNWIDTGSPTGVLSQDGKFTSPNNAKYLRFRNFADDYNLFLNGKIKLEKSNKATPYSPYGMGSISEKVVNGNLANLEYGAINYTTGAETVSNTAIRQKDFIKLNSNESITISSNLANAIGLRIYDERKNYLTPASINAPGTYTNNRGQTVLVKISIALATGESLENAKVMINKGTTALPYVAHQEQNPVIYTQQPMRSIGEVRDDFVKQDGVWYERHKIVRCTLKPTMLTGFDTTYKRFALIEPNIDALETNISQGLSNVGKIITGVSVNTIQSNSFVIRQRPAGGINIWGWLDGVESLEDAQNFLNNNEVYADFEADPTLLPCTQEQVDVLETIYSYSGQTNISSEDVVKAYLRARALKDMNSIETRLEILESQS